MLGGAVAQLGERRPCKAEVVGSIPISSTVRRLHDGQRLWLVIVEPADKWDILWWFFDNCIRVTG